MRVSRWVGLLAILWLVSCTTDRVVGQRTASSTARYRLQVTDRPDQKRFDVRLDSIDDRPLCITVENWPNRHGRLHFGATWVNVTSAEGLFPGGEENFGYCIDENGGPCLIQIPPKSSLKGYIVYKEFGDPAKIAALSQRRLRFPVSPQVCKGAAR